MSTKVRTVLACIAGLLLAGPAEAQSSASEAVPQLEMPTHLKAYTDVDKVVRAVGQTIDLIATTKYDIDLENVRDECRNEETLSILRGMIVAHGAHKAFVNIMEIGWPSMDRSVAAVDYEEKDTADYRVGPALTHPSRQLLWVFWTAPKITTLIKTAEDIRSLPAPIKADLKAFSEFILMSRQWYEMIRDRSTDAWLQTLNTQEKQYSEWRARQQDIEQRTSYVPFSQEAFDKVWPVVLSAAELSKHLQTLQSEVLGLNDKPIEDCLVDIDTALIKSRWDDVVPGKFKVTFGETGQLDVSTGVLPVRYGIFFWHRRHQEGSTQLADYVLRKGLGWLNEPSP